jgi:repressor LexA
MTPRHKECLDFIGAFWADKGYAPSYEEIRDALGAKSKSSVAALVAKLEERGYIQRMPNLARSIRLVAVPMPPKAPQPEAAAPPSDFSDKPLQNPKRYNLKSGKRILTPSKNEDPEDESVPWD